MNNPSTNPMYLDMIGKHYHFAFAQAKPFHKDPGYCRVVGVALHENLDPQLEILAAGDTEAEYYAVDELVFNLMTQGQSNRAIVMSDTV